ncbi:hypothetical protein N8860_05380 [Alphaproteobacteria bacterium]|nr:hypothetical protein [Alphaproteobacteria bacterium]
MAFDYRKSTKANAQISKDYKTLKRRPPKRQPNLCLAKASLGQAKENENE